MIVMLILLIIAILSLPMALAQTIYEINGQTVTVVPQGNGQGLVTVNPTPSPIMPSIPDVRMPTAENPFAIDPSQGSHIANPLNP